MIYYCVSKAIAGGWMEELFKESIECLKRMRNFSEQELRILEDTDKAADEMAAPDFEHYLKHEVDMDAFRIAQKHGLFGIPIKREYGGSDAGTLVAALAKERIGQMGLGFSSSFSVQVFLCGLSLQRWGTEEQKKRYLVPNVRGEKIFAFALTEPEAGSDPASMSTTYEKRGDRFVLNGTKYLITNGSIATNIIIFAKSRDNPKEITAFIVDSKNSGFLATQLKEKIGLATSDTAMLEFENVEVQEADVLGQPGKGMHVAYSGLFNGRLGVASSCVGLIEGCLNAAVKRSKERVQFGKPIGRHQLIQKHIAEIRQNLEMARWPTYYAAMRNDEYMKNPDDKALMAEMDLRLSLAKKIASRLAFESADHAVQVFGGFGYSLLSPVGRLFCDSRVARIYEGSDEIQELKIASAVLGDDFKAFD